MNKKLKAIFVGGELEGMAVELTAAHPILNAIIEGVAKDGLTLIERRKHVYQLISNEKPLVYKPKPIQM